MKKQALFVCRLPLLAAAAWSLIGCASDSAAPVDNTAMLPENQRVSNVPWNRPADWEGRSALGALSNDPRFSGGR